MFFWSDYTYNFLLPTLNQSFFCKPLFTRKGKLNLKTFHSTLLDIYRISVGEKLKNIKWKYNNPKTTHIFVSYYYSINYSRFSTNLWESLMNFMVDIKMLWFFLSSNLSLPYKTKSINLLTSFNSFIRADLFA